MKRVEKNFIGGKYVGLTENEVALSAEKNGRNIMTRQKKKSFIAHFLSNLNDPVIRILLIALLFNLVFVFFGGDIFETVGIGISVILATLISTMSERGSQAAFERLSEECGRDSARVIRGGRLTVIPVEEIVVGDIMLLGAGEGIAADGYILEGRIGVDQSTMTGESREVEKLPASRRGKGPNEKNTALRGCSVLFGEAVVEVFAVGDSTALGQISREVQTDTRDSPLKLRLSVLSRQISRLGYMAAILVSLAYLFNNFFIDSGFRTELILMKLGNAPYLLENLLHAFMLGLTVIVVAVPEGLPMMIAVVLSANIKRMTRDNVLVRKPVGIEAAGSMNILFTDKTGTLTEGKMSVRRVFTAMGDYSSASELSAASPNIAKIYGMSCRYNSDCQEGQGEAIGGNATDRALFTSVRGLDVSEKVKITDKIAFDSQRKYSAVRLSGMYSGVLIKGAPDLLLPYIKYIYAKEGVVSFSKYSYDILKRTNSATAAGGRVIFITECDRMPIDRAIAPMTLVCAVLLCDRVRAEARQSVSDLQGAGIQVVMITGDAKETAASIARETGILCPRRDLVLTGEELSKIDDRALLHLLPRLSVVARALPSDKSRLVRASQSADLVVGMTGDGINDAPALKASDVGFAMGGGTHVAKEAGDIIILDGNLSSVARAVLYGRNIFKSIRKFITLQLTMNFCAVAVSMIGPFIGFEAPVTVVQMLWINIIMDTLGGLAFAGEAPRPSCMKERPKRRDEPILNGYMKNQIILLGGFTVGLYLFFLLSPTVSQRFRAGEGNIYLLTAFFALFIFTSVFNCFNARTDRLKLFAGLSENLVFVAIMLLISIVQIVFIYLGGSVLRTAPLTLEELRDTLILSFLVFPFDFIRKILWRILGKKEGF